jgi:uncharacterized RDD family membrane protein YckC/pSer/pThr/pTyr-binding forkhead associated (FHA) protein
MSKYILKYEGKEIEIGDGIYILGRSKDCDIKFQNESVSRKHARLAIIKDKIFVEDLGSSNGSFLNGKLIRGETLVKPEDRLHFGKVVVIIKKLEETAEVQLCPNCKSEVQANMYFCMQCGTPIKKKEVALEKIEDSTAEMERQMGSAKVEEPDTNEASEEELKPVPEKKSISAEEKVEPPQKPIKPPIQTPSPPAPPKIAPPIKTPDIPQKKYDFKPSIEEQYHKEEIVEMKPIKNKPAGFWIRLLAYFIDILILDFIYFIIFCLIIGPYLLIKGQSIIVKDLDQVLSPLFIFLLMLSMIISLIIGIYYVVGGPAKRGGTPGKRILGLKIYTINGATPIGWQISFKRFLGYIVSALCLYIGFIMIAFRADKRGLHDLIAKTVVVKEKK